MYRNLINKMQMYNLDMIKCGFTEYCGISKKKFSFKNTNQYCRYFDNYFNGVLNMVVWNGIYKTSLVKKVNFPSGLVYEDNYASGMYLFFAERYMLVKECYYNYRMTFVGLGKSGDRRPLDRVLVIKKLIEDLEMAGYYNKNLYWKISVEIYHFIRRTTSIYRVKVIDDNLFKFVISNLDLRRKISFTLLLFKRRIKRIR